MTDAWFHNAIATDSPDGEGCRPEEALALKSYLHSLHQHRRMLPPNSPLQPLTFPLQANPSSISEVLSSTLLIEIPGCQKYIIDLLLKIQQLPDVNLSEEQRKYALRDTTEVVWRDLPGLAHMWYDTLWWYYYSQWRVDITHICPSKLQHVKNIAADIKR